jgi:aconitate hydratase
MPDLNSFDAKRTLDVRGDMYAYSSLEAAEASGAGDFSRLPYALKVLAENLLRNEDGRAVSAEDIAALGRWTEARGADREIAYHPVRIIMPDLSGIPLMADLAAMRDAIERLGGNAQAINPKVPLDLIVDHSVIVDFHGTPDALAKNMELEYRRNGERYRFLKWGQQAYKGVRIVPPGVGILHQVNLEYLAQVVWTEECEGETWAMPDCLLGMDSHTPMINALGVFGWGVGGLEAGAAMLGQPVSMVIPEVVGCRLSGELGPGATATDLVLSAVERLRAFGVVQKFVEFCGPGLDTLALPDRATLANMAPEYGATMGFCPIDGETLRYLEATGRKADQIALVEAYAKEQGLWRGTGAPRADEPLYSDVVEIDLGAIEPCVAGPTRPNQHTPLAQVPARFKEMLGGNGADPSADIASDIGDGAVVLTAITSCTNTSNPAVMLGAGLLARNAVKRGLQVKPWVKTSLAPGSAVVADYLQASGLQDDLDALGFNIVGFGCMTCMGNSGPLAAPVADAIEQNDLAVAAVLSGNRNFEGRVHPLCRANYLASPPLVVAYALAGSVEIDLTTDPLGEDADGNPVALADIWPSRAEVEAVIDETLTPEMFHERYRTAHEGGVEWRAIEASSGATYAWDAASTYIQRPPHFDDIPRDPPPACDIRGARALAIVGDMTTTDHISPVGAIPADGPAGEYLIAHQVSPRDFNSYGARRVNHEVMIRGTFANIRFHNEITPGREGGFTRHMPSGEKATIYEAAMRYHAEKVPLVVIGGTAYGAGSSRDWAAKGTKLLGVRAVIAEDLERIHRSNLIGMGVLPLQFEAGVTRLTLGLDGTESFDITGLEDGLAPGTTVACRITRADGSTQDIELLCHLDTEVEVEYYRHGGMLHYCLREALD